MPRINRVDIGDEVYHVLNRSNARLQIFDNNKDYQQFEEILDEAVEKFNMRLLAYCLMPNHWHLVLCPRNDGELQKFMSWLTNTHTRRWHVTKKNIGHGHLYQGRYKSFVCEQDEHLFTVLRYVERNAKTANLVKKAEDWRWSSLWRRQNGTTKQKYLLSARPTHMPRNYLSVVNMALTLNEIAKLEQSEEKNIPFGGEAWTDQTVKKYSIEQVLRGVGRPKNGG